MIVLTKEEAIYLFEHLPKSYQTKEGVVLERKTPEKANVAIGIDYENDTLEYCHVPLMVYDRNGEDVTAKAVENFRMIVIDGVAYEIGEIYIPNHSVFTYSENEEHYYCIKSQSKIEKKVLDFLSIAIKGILAFLIGKLIFLLFS